MITTAADLARRLERLEAIEAIRQLKARYLNACDAQDPERASQCFAPGEVLIDMGHLGVFRHRDEFAALYRAAGCHEFVLDLHQGANPEIEILDNAHARAVWSLNYRNINTRDHTVTFLGVVYRDEYVKLEHEWKIATCRVEYRTALHLSYATGTLQALHAGKSMAGQEGRGKPLLLSLGEISDRLEIQQLMTAYSSAIDQRDFERLDTIFTPDAYIDYRAMGGIDGRYPAIKAWLEPALRWFPRYYHLVANTEMVLSGDTATCRCVCFNPMQVPLPDGGSQVMFLGLWYIDKLVRTGAGWRISERVQEACYQHNVPAHVKAGT